MIKEATANPIAKSADLSITVHYSDKSRHMGYIKAEYDGGLLEFDLWLERKDSTHDTRHGELRKDTRRLYSLGIAQSGTDKKMSPDIFKKFFAEPVADAIRAYKQSGQLWSYYEIRLGSPTTQQVWNEFWSSF